MAYAVRTSLADRQGILAGSFDFQPAMNTFMSHHDQQQPALDVELMSNQMQRIDLQLRDFGQELRAGFSRAEAQQASLSQQLAETQACFDQLPVRTSTPIPAARLDHLAQRCDRLKVQVERDQKLRMKIWQAVLSALENNQCTTRKLPTSRLQASTEVAEKRMKTSEVFYDMPSVEDASELVTEKETRERQKHTKKTKAESRDHDARESRRRRRHEKRAESTRPAGPVDAAELKLVREKAAALNTDEAADAGSTTLCSLGTRQEKLQLQPSESEVKKFQEIGTAQARSCKIAQVSGNSLQPSGDVSSLQVISECSHTADQKLLKALEATDSVQKIIFCHSLPSLAAANHASEGSALEATEEDAMVECSLFGFKQIQPPMRPLKAGAAHKVSATAGFGEILDARQRSPLKKAASPHHLEPEDVQTPSTDFGTSAQPTNLLTAEADLAGTLTHVSMTGSDAKMETADWNLLTPPSRPQTDTLSPCKTENPGCQSDEDLKFSTSTKQGQGSGKLPPAHADRLLDTRFAAEVQDDFQNDTSVMNDGCLQLHTLLCKTIEVLVPQPLQDDAALVCHWYASIGEITNAHTASSPFHAGSMPVNLDWCTSLAVNADAAVDLRLTVATQDGEHLGVYFGALNDLRIDDDFGSQNLNLQNVHGTFARVVLHFAAPIATQAQQGASDTCAFHEPSDEAREHIGQHLFPEYSSQASGHCPVLADRFPEAALFEVHDQDPLYQTSSPMSYAKYDNNFPVECEQIENSAQGKGDDPASNTSYEATLELSSQAVRLPEALVSSKIGRGYTFSCTSIVLANPLLPCLGQAFVCHLYASIDEVVEHEASELFTPQPAGIPTNLDWSVFLAVAGEADVELKFTVATKDGEHLGAFFGNLSDVVSSLCYHETELTLWSTDGVFAKAATKVLLQEVQCPQSSLLSLDRVQLPSQSLASSYQRQSIQAADLAPCSLERTIDRAAANLQPAVGAHQSNLKEVSVVESRSPVPLSALPSLVDVAKDSSLLALPRSMPQEQAHQFLASAEDMLAATSSGDEDYWADPEAEKEVHPSEVGAKATAVWPLKAGAQRRARLKQRALSQGGEAQSACKATRAATLAAVTLSCQPPRAASTYLLGDGVDSFRSRAGVRLACSE